MKKKFFKTISLVLLGFVLTGCGNKADEESSGSEDGKTTISFTWWGSEVRHEKYIESIKAFEKENPDIKVEYEYGSWDDYWKKLATKSASGELPDVIQMDLQYIAQYGTKNQLADMSEFIGKEIKTDDIKDSILATGELDGSVFGVPASVNTMAMLYNPSMVEKGGAAIDFDTYSFEDLVNSSKTIAKATGEYGWNDNNDNSTIMQYYLRTKGEDLYRYDADGKPEIGFSKENWVNFMQAITDLSKDKALPTAEVTSNAKSFDEYPFSQGKAAYMMTWSNQYLTYKASAADGVEMNLTRPFDSENGAMAYRPGFFYSISNKSKAKDAAAKFVDFLVNSEEANKIIGTERGIPANDAIKQLLYPDMTPDEQESSDFLDDIADIVGDPSPVPPIGFAEINTYFKELYAEITYGTMTPDETYDAFTKKCEEIFAENYE
ncbi:ABC transporter substrate-binding protein [Enterococcus sp.]|jgi:multiple sugar transport system substrate-binding protein|uniref:ABC transporter substrate-binding protein n=1 Tax=Enterococcus sp. TaxID=35783 RepID=UPI0025BFBB13|nr:ABC transporter substrate-binding protein [Enterococcus sp.]